MKYICDTASLFEEMVRGIYSTPAPKMETHTCYYCNHEGTDVNRIATPLSKFNEQQTVYCCDDAIMCDERWQNVGNGRLEREIRRAVNGELFMRTLLVAKSRHKLSDTITARIMKLLDLPF